MSTNIIPIKTINMPTIAGAFGYQESDLTEGAALGFPVLTYRGKVWRVNHKGDSTALLTPDKDPIPSVRVILLRANSHLSKIFYEKSYTEGDSDAPDCFSMNGTAPDSASTKPQCKTCAACPQAAWGSKMSDDGKEMKACTDSRRLVVVPSNDIANEGLGGPMLLRVPAASLGNLVTYDNLLKKANAAYFGVATKVSFDMEAAYPKLVFEYDGPATERLNEEHAKLIIEMRESPEALRILEQQSKQENASGQDVPAPTDGPVAAPIVNAVIPVEEPPAATIAVVPDIKSVEVEVPPTQADAGVVAEAPTVLDVDALVDGLLQG